MNTEQTIAELHREVRDNLVNNILPFWMKYCIDPEGGFRGRITGEGKIDSQAPKGAVLNARILWAFSAAFRKFGNTDYLKMAERAKREIIDRFYDHDFGGIIWSLDCHGQPLDTKKQIYAIGFAIYGLAEFARATGDKEALEYAVRLFRDIENHSFDNVKNGYVEALDREWGEMQDVRLSDKDANEHKTMNTHLHIIEPYTALYRIWPEKQLKQRIENLIYIFRQKILDKGSGHLRLFFDDDWNSRHDIVSFGHDIEASWLIHEAAEAIDEVSDSILMDVERIAEAASEGYIPGGGMIYELHKDTGAIDADRHWWVQAETVVGYLNLFVLNRNERYLNYATDAWQFIRRHLVDSKNGEWFWSLRSDGMQNTVDDKAGFWKCPYHNTRMCLEVMERVESLKSTIKTAEL